MYIYGSFCLFQLLLISKKLTEVHSVLSEAGGMIESWTTPATATQKESLRVFFLVLQVCHYLMVGQVLFFKYNQQKVRLFFSSYIHQGGIILKSLKYMMIYANGSLATGRVSARSDTVNPSLVSLS